MKALLTYQIRVTGRIDEPALASFAGLTVRLCDETMVIIGQFDQAALHGMLEMIRSLGLDLLETRQIDASPPTDDPGVTDQGRLVVIQPDRQRRLR